MDSKNINDLPDEDLEAIFKFVDKKSLKEAILTCERWKDVIEKTITWTLVISDEDDTSSLLDSNRKFHKITFQNIKIEHPLIEILKRQSEHLQELTLVNCILSQNFRSPVDEDLPILNKLKTLVLKESPCVFLDWFKNVQLDALKILSPLEEIYQHSLITFLATQRNLETFIFLSLFTHSSIIFQSPIHDDIIQFRLKKLSLRYINLRSPNDYNNVLKFMKIHSKTIVELYLGGKFPDYVYEFVFSQLKNLKTLCMDTHSFCKEAEFFDRLEENKSITTFKLSGFHFNGKVLRRLPNIENLDIWKWSVAENPQALSPNLLKLKRLSMFLFDQTENLQFPALVVLRIIHFPSSDKLIDFMNRHAGISTLVIHGFIGNREIEHITRNLKKLNTLSLYCQNIVADKNFFDIIRQNCKELKSFNIYQRCMKISTDQVADITGLRFHVTPWKDTSFDEFYYELI